MPYSKNPHKYPPEMEQLLAALMTGKYEQLMLECDTPQEAASRRVMIQTYFRAVERHAQELIDASNKVRQRLISAKNATGIGKADVEAEYREASALATTWEQRSMAAMKWMVKMDGCRVLIERRTVSAGFSKSLSQALASQITNTHAAAPARKPTEMDTAVDDGLHYVMKGVPPHWWPAHINPNAEAAQRADLLSTVLVEVFGEAADRLYDTTMQLVMLKSIGQ